MYKFIVGYIMDNGYPPSISEMKGCMDVHSASVLLKYLERLEQAGKIEVKKNRSRAIKVIGYQFVKCE